MRNPIEVLKTYTTKSQDSTYKFQRIYRNLYNPEFYLLAYKNIYANGGSMTPGVDGETVDGMSLRRIERIITRLQDDSYQPNPARRTYIAKKNSNKKRPLGIPSGDDKLVQEVIRMILESLYEPNFSKQSHGFRPNRSCHTALIQIRESFTGCNWFVEGDISACFDSFDHHVLINILRRRIDDERFIRLMWKFLKAGYMEQWKYYKTYCGTPQGSGMSPVLANIYLSELDEYMAEVKAQFDIGSSRRYAPEYRSNVCKVYNLRKKYEKIWGNLSIEERAEKAREVRRLQQKTHKMQSRLNMDDTFKALQYVRYADDFIVGIIGSKEDAEQVKEELRVFLSEKLKLTLSPEKTKITHTTGFARFLGYDITVSRSTEVKRDKRGIKKRVFYGKVKLYVPTDKWFSKLIEYRAIKIKKDETGKEHWKAIHRNALVARTDIEILGKYNSEIRGLYNFYSIAHNASVIAKLGYWMQKSMYKTFAAKYRSTVKKIKAKYAVNGVFTISYMTKMGLKESVPYKGYGRKEYPLLIQVDLLPQYKRYDNPNSFAGKLKSGTCELCGSTSGPIEIHQVKRLKDLKGNRPWEILMKQRRRITLAVCSKCHKDIHTCD
jgi:group II intron reverse transcriptase/maturase